jgi:predicted nucleic acid-binding protein
MADKVVDASALGALLFNEPEDEMVVAKLRGARLHAPTLLTYELANICWKKIRRGEGAEQMLEKLAVLDSLDIQYHDVPAIAAAALEHDNFRLTIFACPSTFRLTSFAQVSG